MTRSLALVADLKKRAAGDWEVVVVPDSELSSEEKRLTRIEAIDTTITSMKRLFWTDGLDPVLDASWTLKKSNDPRFPLMPGALKADHVKQNSFVASAYVQEELYQTLLNLHAEALLCISSDAWIKLAGYLKRPKFEGTLKSQ
jgi:hypothetical protein